MRLRNKKTGEIAEASILNFELVVRYDDGRVEKYPLLFDYSNFEYYKEPKEYWFIGEDGNPHAVPSEHYIFIERIKEIGNYFATTEEAELAVRKLKAWKRLKDKGFEFECAGKYENLCGNGFEIPVRAIMPPENYADIEVGKDLDLLFGMEDEE